MWSLVVRTETPLPLGMRVIEFELSICNFGKLAFLRFYGMCVLL